MSQKHYEALFSEMVENDANAKNCLSFLKALLLGLWEEKESFSAKRPFGNSDWEYCLYTSLIKNKYISGTLDEYGDIENFDQKEANEFVSKMIEMMFEAVYNYRDLE